MKRKDIAIDCFEKGYNGCQSVLLSFADELNISKEELIKISSGFGSGMKQGGTCGPLVAAIMIIGMKYGSKLPNETYSRGKVYLLNREIQKRFEIKMGSTICMDILGYNPVDPQSKVEIQEQNLFNKICPRAIENAISILEDTLVDVL